VNEEEDVKLLRACVHTGRPLGAQAFLATVEQDLGRILRHQKPAAREVRGVKYGVPGTREGSPRS